MLAVETLKTEIIKKRKDLEIAQSEVKRIEIEIKELEHGVLLLSTQNQIQETKTVVTTLSSVQPKLNIEKISVLYGEQNRTIYRQAVTDMIEKIGKIPNDTPFKASTEFIDIVKKYHPNLKTPANTVSYYVQFLLDKKFIERKTGQTYIRSVKINDMSPEELQTRIEQERQMQHDVQGR